MKPTIDFCIHSDVYNLVISDFSDWNLIENQPAIIEITIPGYSTPIKKYFEKNKVVAYNSISLEINCGDDPTKFEKLTLPDGIYEIKVTGSPEIYNKEKKYLKTDNLQLQLDKILIDAINKDCFKKIKDKLSEINFLLSTARAFIRYDNVSKSMMSFEKACDMVEDLEDCNTCGCD